MDPQTAWFSMRDAFASGEWRLAREYALSLRRWLANGGFAPVVGKDADADWDRFVALTVADRVRQVASRMR